MSFGKGGNNPPPAPDPNQLIQQQQQANRVNVVSPDGQATYGAPNDTLTISESPFQQTQRGRREQLATSLNSPAQQIAGQVSGNPIDFSSIPKYGYQLDYNNIMPQAGVVGPGGLLGSGAIQSGEGGAYDPQAIQYGVDKGYLDQPLSLTQGRANEFQDYGQQGNELEQATFQRARSLLRPEYDRERSRLESQLVNRGLPRNSEAGMQELDRLDRSQRESMDRLAQGSVAAGRQEQGRLFGQQIQEAQNTRANRGQLFGEDTQQAALRNSAQNQSYNQALSSQQQQQSLRSADLAEQMQQYQMQNAARNQALNEQLLGTNQQLNMLQAILGQTPSFALPNFPSPSNIDVLGPASMAYQGQLNSYNQRQQQQQNNMSGLYGLLGGGLQAAAAGGLISTREAKFISHELDGAKIVEMLKELPVFAWAYKDNYEPHVGPMAEDFQQAFKMGDGKTINIIDALGILFAVVKHLAERANTPMIGTTHTRG